MMTSYKVACIVPTRNGCGQLGRLLESLDRQSLKPDLFVIDSNSSDGTPDIAKSRALAVDSIREDEFNHGGTRQLMVGRYPGYDFYVFLTQDAYLDDEHAIEELVAPFQDDNIGAVCGRQLPHHTASALAQHARYFNYPDISRTVSFSDAPRLGMKVAFMSNSFAAYRAEALTDIGGFPQHLILAEDMYVAARLLQSGWSVAYASRACCRHSHDYTFAEEFRRYFDVGVFHAREAWIRRSFGSAGGEGVRFVISEMGFLGLRRLHLWPSSVFKNAAKLCGYKLGQQEARLPLWLKRKWSMHRRFWDGRYA